MVQDIINPRHFANHYNYITILIAQTPRLNLSTSNKTMAKTDKDPKEATTKSSKTFNMNNYPLVSQQIQQFGMPIGVGSVMGFCAGYATKRIGKVIAVGVGAAFIGLQV